MKEIPLKKAVPALLFMCDESRAMAFSEIQKRKAAGLPAFNMPFYMGACFILYITWIGFAALGAAVGPCSVMSPLGGSVWRFLPYFWFY